MEILKVTANREGRVDSVLAEQMDKTRSYVKNLIEAGNVLMNGKAVKSSRNIKVGEEIEVHVPENVELDLTPVDIDLDIVYQDSDLAVINKQQGLVVHAGNGTKNEPTLVNALLYHLDSLSGINGVVRPGIVHRIDKNTSGLLVVAKNDKAHVALSNQIKDKTCHRIYLALLEGIVKDDKGTIDTYIGRSNSNRTMMEVKSSGGRRAITHYEVVKRYKEHTLVRFFLETGRTHQIRVHAKHIGHPVVGDPVYGYRNQKFKLDGQLLHAERLEFIHPSTGKKMSFDAPLPDYFQNVLNKL